MSPWIVGKPAFVFPFHIIKEAYTGRVLHFRNRPENVTARHGVPATVRIPYLPPGFAYQLTPYQKDSELVDSQEPVDADCKSLTRVLQSKRTVRTNRNGFTGFAFLREFPKGTTRF